MIAPAAIVDHLWQSTLFAVATGLLTLAFRRGPARVRYWLWLAASMKFLIPFTLLVSVGSHITWRTAPAQADFFAKAQSVSRPFTITEPPITHPIPQQESSQLPIAIPVSIWFCGFAAISFSWSVRWLRIRAEVRAASPVRLAAGIRALSSPALREPAVFGIFRPLLMLPAGIVDQLTPAEMRAILTHELCHIRNRDNLTAALHMCVEAIFWFHPLVWWIGARLVEERERTCDEEVLRLGGQAQIYAEGILKTCRFYLTSQLACVSGVSGSNLTKRITRIMSNCPTVTIGLGRKLLLASAAVSSLIGPLIFGLLSAPPSIAKAPAAHDSFASAPSAKPFARQANSAPTTPKAGAAHAKSQTFVDAQFITGKPPDTAGMPWEALGKHIRVEANAHINAHGTVTAVQLSNFDEDGPIGAVIIAAIKQWKFQAATLNGQPVECDHPITLTLYPQEKDAIPAPVAAPPTPAQTESLKGGVYVAPKLLYRSNPQLIGLVSNSTTFKMSARIDTEGRISAVQPSNFDAKSAAGIAVLSAVKQWTYQPATLNGQPVEDRQTITINFYIDPNASADTKPNLDASFVAPKAIMQVMPKTRDIPKELITTIIRLEVQVRVDSSGLVASAQVKDFDARSPVAQAALSAAKQWTFQPATLNGHPTEANHTIVFEFHPDK